MVRIVNVANTSQFSVNNLNFTHEGDVALFSKATSVALPDQSLETLPSRGLNWKRKTPPCLWQACNFTIAPATFLAQNDIDGQGTIDRTLDHSILETYLSTATVTVSNTQGIRFTANADRFVDRFEDFVYAAAESLYKEISLTVNGSGTGIGTVGFTWNVDGNGGGSAVAGSCGVPSSAIFPCIISSPSGVIVTLTAQADTNSIFAGWSGGGCSGTGTCSVTMDTAKSVTASFNLSEGGSDTATQPSETGQRTASGTYTYTSGTLTMNTVTSDFTCQSITVGTLTVTSLTSTNLEWIDPVTGIGTLVWTRSSGADGNIVGTWTRTELGNGNSYLLTFDSNGTWYINGNIVSCSSGVY